MTGERNPDSTQWFYRPIWKEAALPIDLDSGLGGAVVLLLSRAPAGDALLEALAGARVIQVTLGSGFECAGTDRYVIAHDDESCYAELAATLADNGTLPRYVLHTLLVDDTAWSRDGSGFARTQSLGLESVVFLMRQLAQGRGGTGGTDLRGGRRFRFRGRLRGGAREPRQVHRHRRYPHVSVRAPGDRLSHRGRYVRCT